MATKGSLGKTSSRVSYAARSTTVPMLSQLADAFINCPARIKRRRGVPPPDVLTNAVLQTVSPKKTRSQFSKIFLFY
jgi:hypothetical protein